MEEQVLLIGGTGALGAGIARALQARGMSFRALVRPGASTDVLRDAGAHLVEGDLRDRGSLEAACRGVRAVISTVNVIAPRRGDDFDDILGRGYANLAAACRTEGVRQILYVSIPVTPLDDRVPVLRYKRSIEGVLQGSGVPCTVLRPGFFIDDWFTLYGSEIPYQGAEQPLLGRSYWFTRLYMTLIGTLVERRGLAIVPGDGSARLAFVAMRDVAEVLVAAVGRSDAIGVLDLAGPEVLTWDDGVTAFARALGRPVRGVHLPAWTLRACQVALAPFSKPASSIMGLFWVAAHHDVLAGFGATWPEQWLGRPLQTVGAFLDRRVVAYRAGQIASTSQSDAASVTPSART